MILTSILFGFLTNFIAVSTTILTILGIYMWPHIAKEKHKGKLLRGQPGPRRVPFFGNALALAKPREEFIPTLTSWFKAHGPRFLFKIGPGDWRIFLGNPKDMEIALKSQTEITKSREYERLIPWLGLGLLTSTGERWSKRRKLLTPAFHFKILGEFMDAFNAQSDTLVRILKTECCTDEVFDISPYICRCALDIICETAMGTTVNAQIDRNSPYVTAVNSLFTARKYFLEWPVSNYTELCGRGSFRSYYGEFLHLEGKKLNCLRLFMALQIKLFKKESKNCILKAVMRISGTKKISIPRTLQLNTPIEKTMRNYINRGLSYRNFIYAGAGKQKLAFLDTLIEAQKDPANNLTDDDLREETDTFMFEGHDTTSSSENFTVFLLASHPNIQKKVQMELNEIFQDDHTRPITIEDLSKMTFLECCLKESLRLYPSVAFVARTLQNDLQFDDKLTAPKGATLILCPYFLHRDPITFPDPEKFIPDRFLPENVEGRDPFAYLPFSAGPRNCIGQRFAMLKEKTLIANLFRHFTIEAAQSQENLVIISDLVTRSQSGIQIKLTPRLENRT